MAWQAPAGTLILYATAPGSVAIDGDGRNGLYTSKLLPQMDNHLQIEEAIKNVMSEVKRDSQGKQIPWMEGNIEGRFCFGGCLSAPSVVALRPSGRSGDQIEDEFWDAANRSGDVRDYETYLRHYPVGRYFALAELRIQQAQRVRTSSSPVVASTTPVVAAARTSGVPVTTPVVRPIPVAAPVPAPAPAQTQLSAIEPDMAKIPDGEFMMGCLEGRDNKCKGDEKPSHQVKLKAFEIGKSEVTVAEFRAFVQATKYRTEAERNANGLEGCLGLLNGKWSWIKGLHWDSPEHQQTEDHPVVCISWHDVQMYVNWLSEKTKKHYRLPTEAEWEYVCRAGEKREFCVGEHLSLLWAADPSLVRPREVMRKWSAGWGVADMSGNVWEWLQDRYQENYNNAPTDGNAVSGLGGSVVLRGGAWGRDSDVLRAANRVFDAPTARNIRYGFRVARTLP